MKTILFSFLATSFLFYPELVSIKFPIWHSINDCEENINCAKDKTSYTCGKKISPSTATAMVRVAKAGWKLATGCLKSCLKTSSPIWPIGCPHVFTAKRNNVLEEAIRVNPPPPPWISTTNVLLPLIFSILRPNCSFILYQEMEPAKVTNLSAFLVFYVFPIQETE